MYQSVFFFSIGLSDHRLLCVVRLEVFQEKEAKRQKERERWERKGEQQETNLKFENKTKDKVLEFFQF